MVSRAISGATAAVAAGCCSRDLRCLSQVKNNTRFEEARTSRSISCPLLVGISDGTRSMRYGQQLLWSGFGTLKRQELSTGTLRLGAEWPKAAVRRPFKRRHWRIAAEATDRDRFGDRRGGFNADDIWEHANEMAANVKRKTAEVVHDLKRKAVRLEREQDLTGRAKRATRSAAVRLEELGDDLRRQFDNADRKFKISDSAKKAVANAKVSFEDADQQYGLTRRFRNFMADFNRNWPIYARRLRKFASTPLGQAASLLLVCWLLVSGWIFTLINLFAVLFLWVLPIALPLMMRFFNKPTAIQGVCPACARPFSGPRNQVLICQSCKGIVWQPREDYSARNDPASMIIDVEPESN